MDSTGRRRPNTGAKPAEAKNSCTATKTASNTADEAISYRVDQSLTTNQPQAGANPRAAAKRPLSLPGADDTPRVHQIKRLTRRVIDGQIVLQHLPVRPLNDYQVAGGLGP